MLSFFALEGALTSPDKHSLYVPIAILLIQLLFIHKVLYAIVIIVLYTGLFVLLSYLNKTPQAYMNDFYIAIATFLSAIIGYMLIARLRHNEGKALVKFENLSMIDALTGLYNKTTIEDMCTNIISEENVSCGLLVIDIDNFKLVNDRYGHDIGDEVLKKVGATLKTYYFEADLVGRFGGDEFIVLIKSWDSFDAARNQAERFIRQIKKQKFSVTELSVQCSVGISMKHQNDDFRSIFNRADHALYTAKNIGKGCCCISE